MEELLSHGTVYQPKPVLINKFKYRLSSLPQAAQSLLNEKLK